eukprot:3743697-Rhodomonas_salina.2
MTGMVWYTVSNGRVLNGAVRIPYTGGGFASGAIVTLRLLLTQGRVEFDVGGRSHGFVTDVEGRVRVAVQFKNDGDSIELLERRAIMRVADSVSDVDGGVGANASQLAPAPDPPDPRYMSPFGGRSVCTNENAVSSAAFSRRLVLNDATLKLTRLFACRSRVFGCCCLGRKVFVGGTKDLDSEEVKEHFERFGAVATTGIMRRIDGKSRGFGFVSFLDRRDAMRAVQKGVTTRKKGNEFARMQVSGRVEGSVVPSDVEPEARIRVDMLSGRLLWHAIGSVAVCSVGARTRRHTDVHTVCVAAATGSCYLRGMYGVAHSPAPTSTALQHRSLVSNTRTLFCVTVQAGLICAAVTWPG